MTGMCVVGGGLACCCCCGGICDVGIDWGGSECIERCPWGGGGMTCPWDTMAAWGGMVAIGWCVLGWPVMGGDWVTE